MDAIPSAGGALLVSNHSGGMFTPDVLVFAPAFYDKFGFDRPVYTLAHPTIFVGPLADWLHRVGVIEANRENAAKALRYGALVLVFPGGDYDSYRSTLSRTRSTSPAAPDTSGPPSNPVCRSCLWCRSARRSHSCSSPAATGWRSAWGCHGFEPRSCRSRSASRSGSACSSRPTFRCRPRSSPQVLEPIDVLKEFGEDPDVDAVDAHVREVMQTALDQLAKKRRFPILG